MTNNVTQGWDNPSICPEMRLDIQNSTLLPDLTTIDGFDDIFKDIEKYNSQYAEDDVQIECEPRIESASHNVPKVELAEPMGQPETVSPDNTETVLAECAPDREPIPVQTVQNTHRDTARYEPVEKTSYTMEAKGIVTDSQVYSPRNQITPIIPSVNSYHSSDQPFKQLQYTNNEPQYGKAPTGRPQVAQPTPTYAEFMRQNQGKYSNPHNSYNGQPLYIETTVETPEYIARKTSQSQSSHSIAPNKRNSTTKPELPSGKSKKISAQEKIKKVVAVCSNSQNITKMSSEIKRLQKELACARTENNGLRRKLESSKGRLNQVVCNQSYIINSAIDECLEQHRRRLCQQCVHSWDYAPVEKKVYEIRHEQESPSSRMRSAHCAHL